MNTPVNTSPTPGAEVSKILSVVVKNVKKNEETIFEKKLAKEKDLGIVSQSGVSPHGSSSGADRAEPSRTVSRQSVSPESVRLAANFSPCRPLGRPLGRTHRFTAQSPGGRPS